MTRIKPRSATVVIYQGDDMDRLAELKRAVDLAERIAERGAASARLGDGTESVDAAKLAYDTFVSEAAERAVPIELRAIGRRRFRDLVLEHPARKVPGNPDDRGRPSEVDHEDDDGYGVNTTTFPMALLTYRDDDAVTIAEPEFPSRADLQRFLDDELAEGDFEQLWIAAFMLNRSPGGDPKALSFGTSLSLSAT